MATEDFDIERGDEGKPPFVSSWRTLYVLVLVNLVRPGSGASFTLERAGALGAGETIKSLRTPDWEARVLELPAGRDTGSAGA